MLNSFAMFLRGNKLCICFSAKTGVLVVTGEHSPHRKNTVSALNSCHVFDHGIVL